MKGLGFALVVCAVLLATPSAAQRPSDGDLEELYQTLRDPGMRTWNQRLLPEFARVADPKTKRVLLATQFRIVRYADFNAFANRDHKRITVPVGVIFTLNNLADALLLAVHEPKRCASEFSGYQRLVSDIYLEAARSNGKQQRPVPDFADLCRISKSEARRIRASDDFYAAKTTIIVDSLALIVGHELAHIVLEHEPYSKVSSRTAREQEYAADAFGMKLATDAGFSPIGGLTVFGFFALIEGGANADSTHPPATCRISRLIEVIIPERKIAESKKELERVGMSQEQYRRYLAELKSECERHSTK